MVKQLLFFISLFSLSFVSAYKEVDQLDMILLPKLRPQKVIMKKQGKYVFWDTHGISVTSLLVRRVIDFKPFKRCSYFVFKTHRDFDDFMVASMEQYKKYLVVFVLFDIATHSYLDCSASDR